MPIWRYAKQRAMATVLDSIQAKQYLEQLDLTFIVNKLCSDLYELPRWPASLAAQAVQLYKDFLWLHSMFPKEEIVPTRDIDECWHLHILNTKRYAKDCEALFGGFFHHQPADLEDADSLAALVPLFKNTQTLYEKEFAKPLMVLNRKLAT